MGQMDLGPDVEMLDHDLRWCRRAPYRSTPPRMIQENIAMTTYDTQFETNEPVVPNIRPGMLNRRFALA